MSAALVILPMVWATAPLPAEEVTEQPKVASGLAFYRKYTEGLLRRYVRLSMESGKVPSLIGKDMFRGNRSNYRVHGFDDMVIFVHDVESCLAKLDKGQRQLIDRIALQEYTQGETAVMTGLSLRTVQRRYLRALDRLTEVFISTGLLEPLKACQGVGSYR